MCLILLDFIGHLVTLETGFSDRFQGARRSADQCQCFTQQQTAFLSGQLALLFPLNVPSPGNTHTEGMTNTVLAYGLVSPTSLIPSHALLAAFATPLQPL